MWWLGSLPCQYSPIKPLRSGWAFSATWNNWSSFAANFSLPPISAIRPGTSCGTYHEYWQLLASVVSPPS